MVSGDVWPHLDHAGYGVIEQLIGHAVVAVAGDADINRRGRGLELHAEFEDALHAIVRRLTIQEPEVRTRQKHTLIFKTLERVAARHDHEVKLGKRLRAIDEGEERLLDALVDQIGHTHHRDELPQLIVCAGPHAPSSEPASAIDISPVDDGIHTVEVEVIRLLFLFVFCHVVMDFYRFLAA